MQYQDKQRARLGSFRQASTFKTTETVSFSGIITIPVVVHVVHNTKDSTIGGSKNANITFEQISSQIKVLNEDYRRKKGTSGYNTNAVGADVEIEFALAQIDPNCRPTSGITRHYDAAPSFDPFTNNVKRFDPWPANDYLNIWVCNVANNTLGVAQFPNFTGLQGIDNVNGDDATDGIIVKHTAFGSRTGTASNSKSFYTYGRTATHEIGHWLGLIHTWGNSSCGTDFCADTPQAEDGNLGGDCRQVNSFCNNISSIAMIENYLDYSPDICMNIFTQDQKTRMWQTMTTSPTRANILKSIRNGINQKTVAPPMAELPILENFESKTNDVAERSANCQGYKAAILREATANTGYFYHSNWVNNVQKASYKLAFDYAYPAGEDTLLVYGYLGCKESKYLVASLTGKNLQTSGSSANKFAPECEEWKSFNLSFTVPHDYFDIQIETNKILKKNMYVDNIEISQFGFTPKLQSRLGGSYVNRVLAGYSIDNQKITVEVLFSKSSNVTFELIDVLGKKIWIESFSEALPGIFEIPVSGLASGIYMVKTKVDNEIVVAKVLVI